MGNIHMYIYTMHESGEKQGHELDVKSQDRDMREGTPVIGRARIGAHTNPDERRRAGERRSVTDCLVPAGREIREMWSR